MSTPAPHVTRQTPRNMVRVPPGRFMMGSSDFCPEERPIREAEIGEFWTDEHLVTNAEFRRFVKGHRVRHRGRTGTRSGRLPGANPADLVPGSQVLTSTAGPVPLDDWTRWWRWVRRRFS